VVHQLLHTGAGLRRELVSFGIINRRGGTTELVRAPRQPTSLPQQRRDRLRRNRLSPVHVIVAHAADCAVRPWYRRAADAGESRAMTKLGALLHERGESGKAET
jgi:TPR repeat protein